MRRTALAVLVLLAAPLACRSTTPGHLSAVSVTALDLPMSIVARDAEGEACGPDTQRNLPGAIEDALARHPEANALVNPSFFKETGCIRVRGTAVRVAPGGAGAD